MCAPSTSPALTYVVTGAWASPVIQLVPIKPGGVRPRPPARSSVPPMPMAATWPLASSFLPGEQVTLPLSEIGRLRVLGFLVDPNAIAPTEVQDGQPSP